MDERTESGLVLFEYACRAKAGDDPFILNNHRSQLRTNHQRIVVGPNGGLMHVSGVEVLDVEDFAKDKRYYRWADRDRSGRWRDDTGRVLAPFLFPSAPWAGGKDEELDPQWVRETFTLSLQEQRDDAVRRYLDRAAAKGWAGDKRGTTLNLIVGADANDYLSQGTTFVATTSTFDSLGERSGVRDLGARFTGATIANGATINTASLYAQSLDSQSGTTCKVIVYGVDADDPAAPTTEAEFNGQALTTGVAWNPVPSTTTNVDLAAPDIASEIQTIVNRAGFASGNAMCTQVRDDASSTNARRNWKDYAGDTANCQQLDIDYTASGATAVKDAIGGGIIPFAR